MDCSTFNNFNCRATSYNTRNAEISNVLSAKLEIYFHSPINITQEISLHQRGNTNTDTNFYDKPRIELRAMRLMLSYLLTKILNAPVDKVKLS